MRNETKFLFVIGNASAGSAQSIGRTDDDGIFEPFCDGHTLFHRIGNIGRHAGLMDFFHRLLEQFPVLRTIDGIQLRTDELDAVTSEESRFCQFAAHRQPRLTAEGSQKTVGLFFDNNSFETLFRERFKINLVRESVIRHDRRGVGVTEHYVYAFAFEYAAGLRTRIVELCGLSDDDGSGTDNENFFNIASFRHGSSPFPYSL